MPQNLYQLLALAARALFVVLAALVTLRAGFNLLGQHRARKKLMKQLPDAGMVGELRDIESDKSYPLPREGVLGGGRGSDIRLKGLRRRHVTFAYVPGKGILISPCHRRSALWLDGEELHRPAYALHGAMLRAGGYTLCVRLFAGLDVPAAAVYQDHWGPAPEEEYFPEGGGYGDAPLFDLQLPDTPPVPAPQPARPAPQPAPPVPETPYVPPAFSSEEDAPFLPEQPRPEEPTDDYFGDQPPQYPAEDIPGGAPRRHRRSDRRRSP